ncbi:MAG: ABC transporter ATP-binding protein/permease [Clostridiales bacterium]|nr:ABC transporter ATP-binding protein/permease [Clostridiales bacterium]
MIQLKEISKTYVTGSLTQKALDKVSLSFRDNEFVAILGPSGSGKTTLLNIIGGLDKYDSGDIIINNVSTREYKDKDWDSYRNHTIGFVFQSYNLIPHQTILSNVELALTISGIGKEERKERALKALEEVGLRDQAYKKPLQMSGGQMQRVAIARALVNNPEIVLADEPTGALDTKTSVQVMDLLKEVAKDRLVIMVTHNEELAEEYATRIVRLKDGVIRGDTAPVVSAEIPENIENRNFGKVKMGFPTALSLSFNNLLTKKGRTILTSFAGSIGIIGIALILSLSQGFQNYINKIQEDMLTSYPLTITEETADFSSIILSMATGVEDEEVKEGTVREKQYMMETADSIGVNDLKTFLKYVEDNRKEVDKSVTRVACTYDVQPLIYTDDVTGKISQINPSNMMNQIMGGSSVAGMSMSTGGAFFEVPADEKILKERYGVIEGRLPEKYNEVMIVLPNETIISDLLVYSLGLRDISEMKTIVADVMAGKKPEVEHDPKTFTYEDLMGIELKLVDPTARYLYNSEYNVYEDMSGDKEYMKKVYDNAEPLKIVGLVSASDNGTGMSSSGVAYTTDLTTYVIETATDSEIVKKQLADEEVDVFSGKRFDEENKDSGLDFSNMITVDENALKEAFGGLTNMSGLSVGGVSQEQTQNIILSVANDYAAKITQGASQTEISAALIKLNTVALTAAIQNYEIANNYDGMLDLSNVEEAANTITAGTYMDIVTQAAGMDPSADSGFAMAQLLSDSEVSDLATAVRTMFLDYYDGVKSSAPGYDPETGKVPYSNDGNQSYYGNSEGQIPGYALLVKACANESALTLTVGVVNRIMTNYTTLMIAAGIGEATGQIMAPMTASLSQIASAMSSFSLDPEKLASAFSFNMSEEELSRLMETMMGSSGAASARTNLVSLGYQSPDKPTSISFYFASFEDKETFMNFLEDYNAKADEEKKISYTDMTGLMMSSMQTIVNSVSYVLIAFVSVSLIVSSIMIAVITLISVMERRKEIGILRAMGASKKNVSSIFNAETFIIGLLSGLTGIGVTLALNPLINAVIHKLTGNYNINAVLPVQYAVILVIISVVLTMLAGFVPSKKASKQDPVIALRSE